MAIRRGAFSALLAPDMRKVYVETYKERPLEYPLLFNVGDMDWNPMTDLQISGLGPMPEKPEGEQYDLDESILGAEKSYEAIPFGLAVEVTYEMFRDELYGVMRELSSELARSSRNRQEVAAHAVLNRAFNSTYDGFTNAEALCGAHTSFADGQVRRNRPVVDIEFSITGLQEAILRFEDMENERGLPSVMSPSMVVVSPAYKFAAREILGSGAKPYTTDNEINSLIQEDLSWMVSHYLTTNTYWFLLASKGVHDLNFFWRDRPSFDNFDDPWTKNAVFTVYQRHTEGQFAAWRGVDGSTGA